MRSAGRSAAFGMGVATSLELHGFVVEYYSLSSSAGLTPVRRHDQGEPDVTKKILIALIAVVAAVGLGACGNEDDPAIETPADGGSSAGDTADHNDADVAFAKGMIPHHAQAIDMADMVLARGESSAVKALATRIKEAQTPEIELMRGWLEDWGEEESADDKEHGMGGSGDETMMTDDEMAELESVSGAALDEMFLEMMIRHHEGAISMAETEVEDGEFEPALDLARQIITAQTAEIEEINALLKDFE